MSRAEMDDTRTGIQVHDALATWTGQDGPASPEVLRDYTRAIQYARGRNPIPGPVVPDLPSVIDRALGEARVAYQGTTDTAACWSPPVAWGEDVVRDLDGRLVPLLQTRPAQLGPAAQAWSEAETRRAAGIAEASLIDRDFDLDRAEMEAGVFREALTMGAVPPSKHFLRCALEATERHREEERRDQLKRLPGNRRAFAARGAAAASAADVFQAAVRDANYGGIWSAFAGWEENFPSSAEEALRYQHVTSHFTPAAMHREAQLRCSLSWGRFLIQWRASFKDGGLIVQWRGQVWARAVAVMTLRSDP